MCGIAGLVDPFETSLSIVNGMLDRLASRGPDDSGTWVDPGAGMALGHRRLSVIDLSPSGHQPMVSASGRFVLTFNGEIYNFEDLRAELNRSDAARVWRGHSDTEVLVAGFEAWGIDATLARCNGMFALALWDTHDRVLMLARDRMGEKPLYFGWVASRFAFASELKAFDSLSGWTPKMNTVAIGSFLRTGYVRGPESAIEGVFRLPPACSLSLSLDQMRESHDWEWLARRIKNYWSLAPIATAGQAQQIDPTESAFDQLESLLLNAVKLRMAADVPLGAFLSGGIDSSLISALMQAQSSRKVRTFSIGFHEPEHDEAPFARAIAHYLGTDHVELYVDAKSALDLAPNLTETYSEPFADTSALPTLLISKLTHQKVTVALTGDGGDELFAGYGRYFSILKLARAVRYLPPALRRSAANVIAVAARAVPPQSRSNRSIGALHDRLARMSERLSASNLEALRLSFVSGAGRSRILCNVAPHSMICQAPAGVRDPLRRLMYGDQVDYLCDDILVKVDRAAMMHSLETRVPLLDHRVVEFSWRMPTHSLVDGKRGKMPLRRILEKYVPPALVERPKQGFVPPIDAWLRGPLLEWAESRLTADKLRELPMLDAQAVRDLWTAHCRHATDAGHPLWKVLMLIDWRERFKVACQ